MSKQENIDINFQIQRIYIKDISFEAPNTPGIFQKDWKAEVNLDLDTTSNQISENTYEVVLRITVVATLGHDTAFLCELQQAGLFNISVMSHDRIARCLGSYCPTILFPYARECITNQVSRATFPQLNLAPINFDEPFIDRLQNII